MYYIMNKDKKIMEFDFIKNNLGIYEPSAVSGQLPELFKSLSLKQWLEMRRPAKHRTEIQKLLRSLDMLSLKGFIDTAKGLTLTDTFWVKSDSDCLAWADVSLYRNNFSDIIANSAFLGSLPELRLKTTSPEYGTDGMLPKCWVRRQNEIYLLKGGIKGWWNSSNEPYTEFFASQLADALGISHIPYNIEMYHGRAVSSCRLFTSESVSMFPSAFIFAECSDISDYIKTIDLLGYGEQFREMLVFDALIFNYDRHLGNMQFLYNADTLEIIGMAPVFDNGAGLASRCRTDNYDDILSYCRSKVPFAYDGFDDMLDYFVSDDMYSRLIAVRDFEFIPDNLVPCRPERLDSLNRLIHERIAEVIKLAES